EVATQRAERAVPDQRGADRRPPWHVHAVRIHHIQRAAIGVVEARHVDAVDPGRIGPQGTAETIALGNARQRELDLCREAGIGHGAEIFAGHEARAEAPALEAADELGATHEGFHRVNAIAAQVIDDTG